MLRRTFALSAALIAFGATLVLRPHAPAVAYPGVDNIVTAEQCANFDSKLVTISWTGYDLGDQWLDVSLYNNGFAAGTFAGLGPIPYWQTAISGEVLESGQLHYFRINTLTAGGWTPSATHTIAPIDCSLAQPVVLVVPAPASPQPEPPAPAQLPATPPAPAPPMPAQLPTTPPPPVPAMGGSNGY